MPEDMKPVWKAKFNDLCKQVQREGMNELMEWLEKSDFYTAPASSRFHGCYPGGLLEHSLNVYEKLCEIVQRYPDLKIDRESVIIVGLFHDLTKANYYAVNYKNVKKYSETGSKTDERGRFDWVSEPFYKTDDRLPLGHGEKSVIILQSFIKLKRDEIYAIRWHMGGFDSAVKGGDGSMSKAYEMSPLAIMTHLADMEASYLVETRKGME